MQKAELAIKNKYETIHDEILHGILSGVYDDKLPGEMELAEFYDVSRVTVRKALSELTEEGYITRSAGKGSFVVPITASKRKNLTCDPASLKTISFIHSMTTTFFLEMFHGIESVMFPRGIQINMATAQESFEKERIAIENAAEMSDGIILYPYPSTSSIQLCEELIVRHYPLVFIDHNVLDIPCCCVGSDGYQGGIQAADYLLNKGHSKIGFSSVNFYKVPLETVNHRRKGLEARLKSRGLSLNPHYCVSGASIEEFKNNLAKILSQPDSPTAIFAASDGTAFAIYEVARDINIRIPEDLSVIGFDNLDISSLISPPLTTIAQPFQNIGEEAAKLLLEQKHAYDEGKSLSDYRFLPIHFVERESVFDLTANKCCKPKDSD